jgi:hypothetical protein
MASSDLAKQLFVAMILATAPLGCSSEPIPETAPRWVPHGARVEFSFPTIDGGTLSTNGVAGRFTVLAFVTTYDRPSQAQARFLTGVVRHHTPRINAGLIVLEPEAHRILVESFVHVLEPPYPVAMADEATIAGEGPFQGLRSVPTVVILDPEGGEAWRHIGLATGDQIDAAVTALQQGKTPPP